MVFSELLSETAFDEFSSTVAVELVFNFALLSVFCEILEVSLWSSVMFVVSETLVVPGELVVVLGVLVAVFGDPVVELGILVEVFGVLVVAFGTLVSEAVLLLEELFGSLTSILCSVCSSETGVVAGTFDEVSSLTGWLLGRSALLDGFDVVSGSD